MRHGSLFSGIGGFDLAAQWMGWENVFHCEINPFCQKVLKHHFPNADSYEDITKFYGRKYRGIIDIISGGWPCQKYSVAGYQRGNEPLKDQMLRVFGEIKPNWGGVFENVGGFLNPKFAKEHNDLCLCLEDMGYQVQTFDIDSPSCGLSTLERHIWVVASNNSFVPKSSGIYKNKDAELQREFSRSNQGEYDRWRTPESRLLRVGEGVSRRVDRDRVGAIGNAIPPQIAYEIFKAIEETTKNNL
jgi:DNA (cytosine-5)-methyltransferase 1